MRSYIGKPLYAVWEFVEDEITTKVAAMTRKRAFELYENEYLTYLTEKDIKRIKYLWSTKEGIIK